MVYIFEFEYFICVLLSRYTTDWLNLLDFLWLNSLFDTIQINNRHALWSLAYLGFCAKTNKIGSVNAVHP